MRVLLALPLFVGAFHAPTTRLSVRSTHRLAAAAAVELADPTTSVRGVRADGLYAADRYVTTLRYLVAKDDQVAFEQTWAARESKLSQAKGFRYFQMSKRAADFMGPPLPDDEPNYMSYAVWNSKADCEAFTEEADAIKHADSAAGVQSTGLGAAARANYDALFCLALPPAEAFMTSATGWRAQDPANAGQKLPREAFVASNRFGIKPGFEKDFEEMWARRDSSLAALPGFKNFALLRREGTADDGNTYVSYTTWQDVQAFNNWRGSDNFKRSHSNNGGAKESPYAKMPKVVTWKCFLCLSFPEGA
jgi:heme-degrading monooxygenase HmoA